MNNPVVYDQSNNLQRQEVRKLLQKYKNKIIWRRDGKDLLDIGCGSGNITIDFLLPMLPSNFERLMGIDKSEKMVFHAREKYSQPKVEFEQFDIVSDKISKLPKFDHIYHFDLLFQLDTKSKISCSKCL